MLQRKKNVDVTKNCRDRKENNVDVTKKILQTSQRKNCRRHKKKKGRGQKKKKKKNVRN